MNLVWRSRSLIFETNEGLARFVLVAAAQNYQSQTSITYLVFCTYESRGYLADSRKRSRLCKRSFGWQQSEVLITGNVRRYLRAS
jgi:hypothetical protein